MATPQVGLHAEVKLILLVGNYPGQSESIYLMQLDTVDTKAFCWKLEFVCKLNILLNMHS